MPEREGEFAHDEQRQAHVAALLEELRGPFADQKEIKAELKRLGVDFSKGDWKQKTEARAATQQELNNAAEESSVAAMYDEEHRINPRLVSHPDGELAKRPVEARPGTAEEYGDPV